MELKTAYNQVLPQQGLTSKLQQLGCYETIVLNSANGFQIPQLRQAPNLYTATLMQRSSNLKCQGKNITMWKLLLINVTLLIATAVYGQKVSSIELDFIGRYDKHADYTTRFGDRSYTNETKLWGKSFGLSVNYIHLLHKHMNAKIGIGYYNLGIDKIRQTTPFNIIATGRNINYRHPSGILPQFATNKYQYDNLSFTLGLAYERPIAKKVNFIAGGDFNYLYTFSQLYHITYDNIRYGTNIGRTLGFAANTYFGLLQKFHTGKYYISPKIIVPICQQLRGDGAFGEDQSVKMEKWFNGVGLSLSVGKYL